MRAILQQGQTSAIKKMRGAGRVGGAPCAGRSRSVQVSYVLCLMSGNHSGRRMLERTFCSVYRALYLPKGYACKVPYKASSSPPPSVRKPGRMVCLVATVPLNDWTSSRHDTGRHEAAKASTRLHAHASHFPLILTQEGGRAIHRHARWRGWSVALLGEGAGRPRPRLTKRELACSFSRARASAITEAHTREHPPRPPDTHTHP